MNILFFRVFLLFVTKFVFLSIHLSEVLIMDKYKINYISTQKKDINDILIDFLSRKLKRNFRITSSLFSDGDKSLGKI